MKKRYSLSLGDVSLIEIADVLFAFWIVGMLLTYYKPWTFTFFYTWKWAFFAVAVIIGVKPMWKLLYGEKSADGSSSKKRRVIKKKRKK